ncbi:MAG: DUF2796 domain-containing protein [Pseudomonadota bacterium]
MRLLLTTALVTCLPVMALAADDGHTELGAHEHGVGVFNVAIEGETVAMELEAPGADIVGFEHAANSDKDKAAVKKAKARLGKLANIVDLPAGAECKLTKASIELHAEGGDHDDHDHGKKAEKDDDHDHDHGHKKKAEKHDDHDHDHDHKKKAEKHDDHDHDHGQKKKAEKHDDHDHEKHEGEEAGHTEFHAEYQLDCHHPERLTGMSFTYFKTFPNARELEVSVTGPSGQKKMEATRDNPRVDLGGIM